MVERRDGSGQPDDDGQLECQQTSFLIPHARTDLTTADFRLPTIIGSDDEGETQQTTVPSDEELGIEDVPQGGVSSVGARKPDHFPLNWNSTNKLGLGETNRTSELEESDEPEDLGDDPGVSREGGEDNNGKKPFGWVMDKFF